MDKKNNPMIRFHNYKELWECDRLKNIFRTIRNAYVGTVTPYYVEKGHFYLESNNVKNGKINYNSQIFINDEFYEKQRDKWLKTNDIVMVQSGHVGHTAVIPKEINNTAAHALIVFTDYKKKVNPHFLNYQFQSSSKKKELDLISTGNTIKHILASEMKSFKMDFPTAEEQSAIGSLFCTLDDLLTSYKDNLANYQSLKAVMLSKMFPKAGQTVPEIRLDGFKGEWEVKKLENVLEFYAGLTYKPNDMVSDGTLVLRSSNVRDGEFIYKDNVFVNPDIVNCQNVKLGDIVVVVRNGSRDLIGKHALIKSEMPNTVIGAFMTGVRCEVPEFVNALLDTNMFISEINKNLGATINQITTGNFKRMKFYFPDKEEQQVIGSYFANLDDLIAAHQEKISQLETLKKKFLQDMFI